MTGNPLILDLLARTIQEERLEMARQRRQASARPTDAAPRAPRVGLWRRLALVGQRLAGLRFAVFSR
ncbi:MAG TPA: hypothetical protein VNN19_02120 [bacterium]|nr:hypothetical protein [bacterium]